jgi:DNA-directed RNA polymerase specialized sigma24 family protein
MYEKYKNEFDRRGPIINYIQNSLRALALIRTNHWQYDADDFVQETILLFLRHEEYLSLELQHQKNIARKIMTNLFLINNMKDWQQRIIFNRQFIDSFNHNPDQRIDLNTLQQYLKEREDRQVNLFWLWNIGYSVKELARMFILDENTIFTALKDGRKKMQRLIREGVPKKKLIRLQVSSPVIEKKVQLIRTKITRDFNPVYQFTLEGQYVKTWINPRVAQNHFGEDQSLVRACLRGSRKTGYGFYWSFNRRFKPDVCNVPFISV